MDRTTNTLVNAAANFLVAFAVGTAVKDRRTGLKAGLVLALVGGLASYLLFERLGDEDDDSFYGIDRVRTGDAER